MVAYAIVEMTVDHDDWREEYLAKFGELLRKHGGGHISNGVPVAKLEGARELPDRLIILEFPSLDQARAWYDDPEYAPLIELRRTGSSAEITLVAGTE